MLSRDHYAVLGVSPDADTEAIEAAAQRIEAETGLAVLRFPKLAEFYIGFRVAA